MSGEETEPMSMEKLREITRRLSSPDGYRIGLISGFDLLHDDAVALQRELVRLLKLQKADEQVVIKSSVSAKQVKWL